MNHKNGCKAHGAQADILKTKALYKLPAWLLACRNDRWLRSCHIMAILTWKDLPIPMTFGYWFLCWGSQHNNTDCCSSVTARWHTARGFLCGVCLCVGPWWGHFLLQQMTGQQKLLWSLVSTSFVKVLRYCSSEHSLKHRSTTDMCTLRTWDDHFRQVTASPLVISFCSADNWARLRSTAQDTAWGVRIFPLQSTWVQFIVSLEMWIPLHWYTAERNLKKQPESFTIKAIISHCSADNTWDTNQQQQDC